METKKSDRANLEKKRSVFFQMGLLISLGFAFVAFEWQVAPRISDLAREPVSTTDIIEIDVVRTFPSEPPPPAPPQPSFELEIVDNTVDLGDAADFTFDIENGSNILSSDLFTQMAVVEIEEDPIFDVVESDALFKGKPAGEAFREYISQNLKYPQVAIENNIFGKVFVQFVVDQKGNVIDVQVVRGADPSLDNEAIRLIKSSSGMWTPGKQREKPVKVRYTFPITFKLQ